MQGAHSVRNSPMACTQRTTYKASVSTLCYTDMGFLMAKDRAARIQTPVFVIDNTRVPYSPACVHSRLKKSRSMWGACRHLLAILGEVDDSSGRMGLHARLREVVHDGHEARQQAHVLGLLHVWAQVCAQLPHRLARRPPHLRMRVPQPLHQYFSWKLLICSIFRSCHAETPSKDVSTSGWSCCALGRQSQANSANQWCAW